MNNNWSSNMKKIFEDSLSQKDAPYIEYGRLGRKWPKCPKCHSQNVEVDELWKNHSISWMPGDKQNEGNLEPGNPFKVEGFCWDCKHNWTFKGIIQIKPEWFEESK
jgi:hypothetical protein